MKRAQLENKYISNSTVKNMNKYKNIKTFGVNCTKREKKVLFSIRY